jgi:hypothetical protein
MTTYSHRQAISNYLDAKEHEKISNLVGKTVIAFGNEVSNLQVYTDVKRLREDSTVLEGINVVSGKTQTVWGEVEEFSVAKFKMYNKLTPHERILLTQPYLEEEDIFAKKAPSSQPLINPKVWETMVFKALKLENYHPMDDFEYPIEDYPNFVEIARYTIRDTEYIVLSCPNGKYHVYNDNTKQIVQPDHDEEGIMRYMAHSLEGLNYLLKKAS